MKRKGKSASTAPDNERKLLKPDIIRGARANDLAEVSAAVAEDAASIFQIDPETGGTALHIAAYRGNLKLARFLLEKGPKSQFKEDRLGRTPCEVATASGYIELGRLFTSFLAASLNLVKRPTSLSNRLENFLNHNDFEPKN